MAEIRDAVGEAISAAFSIGPFWLHFPVYVAAALGAGGYVGYRQPLRLVGPPLIFVGLFATIGSFIFILSYGFFSFFPSLFVMGVGLGASLKPPPGAKSSLAV